MVIKKNEILLGTAEPANINFSGKLYNINSKGKLNWIYDAKDSKKMIYGGEEYINHYRIMGIRVANLFGESDKQIIMHVAHWPYFPSNITVLDNDKNLLGEYWNSGRFHCVDFLDLNGDGVKEIIVGGETNETHGGVLVVLDPRDMWGTSPQDSTKKYFTKSVQRGTEKYFIRFPHSPFYRGRISDGIMRIRCYQNYFIVELANVAMFERKKNLEECVMF